MLERNYSKIIDTLTVKLKYNFKSCQYLDYLNNN